MSCGCSKKIYSSYRSSQYLDIDHKKSSHLIEPFETCPYCATKHIGYALVLYDEDKNKVRCIGQIYLAYKHLEKRFKEEAKLCFELIKDFIEDKFDKDKLKNVVQKIHELTNKKEDKNIKEENLYLENELDDYLKSALYILAAGELYSYEVGYQDINIPYIIGLLQKAAETSDEGLKTILRDMWKKIEENKFYDKFILFYIPSNIFKSRKKALK